jgi:hypothetical protein
MLSSAPRGNVKAPDQIPPPRRRRFSKRARASPGPLGTARSFPIRIGERFDPEQVRGYYTDFRFKARIPTWPPRGVRKGPPRLYVALIQWGLGCYERYLAGEGEAWLDVAVAACDYLVEHQEGEGPRAGGWVHRRPYGHTYDLQPPWVSAIAQGEGASLLVRVHAETGEERYAEAASRALRPMTVPSHEGGVRAALGDGFFLEEYPTTPPSLVLNGGIFALWGLHDVRLALGDARARDLFDEGVETLAANIRRFDTGYWSRYDLFPHPVLNVASSAYHRLHIVQLRATTAIHPSAELERAAARFESYAASRVRFARAFARKAIFRMAVPRNRRVAGLMPWRHRSDP